jgi:N-methylhydantoinase A
MTTNSAKSPERPPLRVAFDIGGTFTDFVVHDGASGAMHFWKVPSTPDDPSRAVLAGLAGVLEANGIAGADVDVILHATTVATNAIIERKGPKTAFVTTTGFRDIIIMGRQKRYDTFDIYLTKPVPLVDRKDVFEVDERIDVHGETVTPLDPASVDRVVAAISDNGYQSAAVAFIHAYVDGEHERRVREAIRARCPGVPVSISSEVSPKMREFERFSTTLANAYVRPVVDRYIGTLESALRERGIDSDLFIMQSNAGLVPPELAREMPIRIVESGPAAGVMMCGVVGRAEGKSDLLTFDMGGTTAKLGAIDAGEPAVMPTFEVATINCRPGSGIPLNISAVELLEIGAGGGSIARTTLGVIRVGPESAGADPGPICYGNGGIEPTVTDANLALGYLNPDYFNGGAMRLDRAAAESGIKRAIADPLGLSVGEAAWGIHTVANANMERAMRVVSVERGRDPRNYSLVSFGGAGPLHATRLARSLGIPEIVIPFGAGVGSAVGLLEADSRIDATVTRVMRIRPDASTQIAELYTDLEKRIRADLSRLKGAGEPRWSRFAYMRYVGQGYERKVDLPGGPIDGGYAAKVAEVFVESYLKNYGFTDPDAEIEAIDWYLVATVPSAGAVHHRFDDAGATGDAIVGTRDAYFPELGGFSRCDVVDRYRLRVSDEVAGPAIVEERESTTVLLPGDVLRISPAGHMVIKVGAIRGTTMRGTK